VTILESVEKIKEELKKHINEEKAAFFPRFFQAFEGGYGEGDRFLGVVVPDQRKVARKYYKLVSLKDIEKLLSEPYHECRLTALFMMVHKFEKAKDEKEREEIVNTYLNNIGAVNNWDLVDSSAPYILGQFLYYSHQCPFTAKYVPLIEGIAHSRNTPFKSIRFETTEQAQNAPAPFTTYSLFYNGEFITNEILSDKKFEKMLINLL
jgi:hypothetical protein